MLKLNFFYLFSSKYYISPSLKAFLILSYPFYFFLTDSILSIQECSGSTHRPAVTIAVLWSSCWLFSCLHQPFLVVASTGFSMVPRTSTHPLFSHIWRLIWIRSHALHFATFYACWAKILYALCLHVLYLEKKDIEVTCHLGKIDPFRTILSRWICDCPRVTDLEG